MPRRPNRSHGAATACRLWQSSLRARKPGSRRLSAVPSDSLFLGLDGRRLRAQRGETAWASPSANVAPEPIVAAVRTRARLCPDRRPRLKFVIGDRRPSPREQSGPDSIPSHQSRRVLRSRCAPSRWSRPARPTGSNPALSLVESRVPSQPIPSRPIPIPPAFVSGPAALPDELLTGRCEGPIRWDFLGETACPVPAFPRAGQLPSETKSPDLATHRPVSFRPHNSSNFSRSNNVSRPGVGPKSRGQSQDLEPSDLAFGHWTGSEDLGLWTLD